MKGAPWNFAVVVRTGERVRYFSLSKTYEEALQSQKDALDVGWQVAKIFDSSLTEVTEQSPEKKKPYPVD